MTKAQERKIIDALHTNAQIAIRIAARKAILRHQQAGVPAVIWKNGRVVKLTSKIARPTLKRK